MPRALYYATNTRMAKDIMQYILHPLFKIGAYGGVRLLNPHMNAQQALDTADVVSSLAGGSIYMLNTASFQAWEAEALDKNARRAVAAELGKDPSDLKFSDYLDSRNVVVQRELEDARKVNKIRYLTDALFFVPAAMYAASHVAPGAGFKNAYQKGRLNRTTRTDHLSFGEVFTGGFNLWDQSIYGAKAAYWMYETYRIDKTAHYEIMKLDETIEAAGKKYTPNDLIAVINRSREDRNISQIQEKDERNALWEVLEHLAYKMNNDPKFGVPELLYLVGLNKINIFELDQQGNEVIEVIDGKRERIISEESIKKTIAEIDKVAALGLDGIAEKNRLANELDTDKKGMSNTQTQVGSTMTTGRFNVANHAERQKMDRSYARSKKIKEMVTSMFGEPRQLTDHISPRDGVSVNVTLSK